MDCHCNRLLMLLTLIVHQTLAETAVRGGLVKVRASLSEHVLFAFCALPFVNFLAYSGGFRWNLNPPKRIACKAGTYPKGRQESVHKTFKIVRGDAFGAHEVYSIYKFIVLQIGASD